MATLCIKLKNSSTNGKILKYDDFVCYPTSYNERTIYAQYNRGGSKLVKIVGGYFIDGNNHVSEITINNWGFTLTYVRTDEECYIIIPDRYHIISIGYQSEDVKYLTTDLKYLPALTKLYASSSGRVVIQGDFKELLHGKNLEELYLGDVNGGIDDETTDVLNTETSLNVFSSYRLQGDITKISALVNLTNLRIFHSLCYGELVTLFDAMAENRTSGTMRVEIAGGVTYNGVYVNQTPIYVTFSDDTTTYPSGWFESDSQGNPI